MKVKERLSVLKTARERVNLLQMRLEAIYVHTIRLLGTDDDDSIVFDYLNNGGNVKDIERRVR